MSGLPPNVQRAYELLLELGGLAATELRERLASEGISLGPALVEQLPTRFPDRFEVAADGRLSAAGDETQSELELELGEPVDSSEGHQRWWLALPAPARIARDRIAVLDIETVGLDPEQGGIWEIAAEGLTDGHSFHQRVRCEGEGVPPLGVGEREASLSEALGALSRFLDPYAAIAGHNIVAFDLPFLRVHAQRADVALGLPDAELDLHRIAQLLRPEMPNRSLSALAAHWGIALNGAHRAGADCSATAGVLRCVIEELDEHPPVDWALAWACLVRAGEPWASVVGPGPLPAELSEVLKPADDSLAGEPPNGTTGGGTQTDGRNRLVTLAARRGFERRPAQEEMTGVVGRILNDGGRVAIEAPTGTGKTLAYLLPAIARARSSGRPVVLATHTKVLQGQLRDEASRLLEEGLLDVPFNEIRGVANYVCTREIADAFEAEDAEGSEWIALATGIRALGRVQSGAWDDVNDYMLRARDVAYSTARARLRTTARECDRSACTWFEQCPLYQRLRAPGGAVVSVNHAVVASWLATKGEVRAPGDVTNDAGTDIVFDEAHALEDAFTSAWTDSVGGIELRVLSGTIWGRRGLVRDARRVRGRDAEPVRALLRLQQRLSEAVERMGEAVLHYLHEFSGDARSIQLAPGLVSGRPEHRVLAAAAGELVSVLRGARSACLSLIETEQEADESTANAERRLRRRAFAVAEDLNDVCALLADIRDLSQPQRFLYLLSRRGERDADLAGDWTFEQIPIEIADRFAAEVVAPSRSVTLTSATLTVAKEFEFLASRLGLRIGDPPEGNEFEVHRLESPFDHRTQSLVVLTGHLPVPIPSNERQFCEELGDDQIGFLSIAGGRTLGLFAARARMEQVADRVLSREAELADSGVRLLVQGRQSAGEIRRRFVEEHGTVAYGVRSYWEGFDAPGETLSYLVLEKAPYPSPSNPLVAARTRALADRGRDPFKEYVLPTTAIQFAQGFGRLIRSESDRGAAIVCDRRLQSPSEASTTLLGSLPDPGFTATEDRAGAWRAAIEFVTGNEPDFDSALIPPLDPTEEVLERLRLLPREDPTAKLAAAALELFGIERLTDEQLALMRAALEGRDALGFLPTGAGKSLCFQLPALLHPSDRPTVVVSPLVALIKDQVDDLRSRRGLRAVQGITSHTTGAQRTEVLRDVADGRVRLLYVSPERLARDVTLRRALATQDLAGLVVDEAHCISMWGHDFRPEFRRISQAVSGFRRSPRMALTATATNRVERDVIRSLSMEEPTVVRASPDRPNLRYRVMHFRSERERTRELLRVAIHQRGRPGIVYAGRRATTEELAWLLRQAGIAARSYHAGMVPEQRESVQEDFLSDTTEVIVATKAFGMGVNKPNIGWIVHFDLPESLEAYVQESGRAARIPSERGECVLFVTPSDFARRRRQVASQSTASDLERACQALDLVLEAPTRAGDRVLDPEAACEHLGLAEDELNVLLSWVERAGAITRLEDCTARGHVVRGLREPADSATRGRFRELVRRHLGARVGARRFVDFAALSSMGEDPDVVEQELTDWTLERFLTFQPTRRAWRFEIQSRHLDEVRYAAGIEEWRAWERARLDQMANYADARECRRQIIARAFDDGPLTCDDRGAIPCDACAPAPAVWHELPLERTPDPEQLVQLDLVVMQAIAWASDYSGGQYGEAGLKAAILGKESLGEGRPLGPGLLRCPQFGALRYLRGAERRVDQKVGEFVQSGLVARERVDRNGRAYATLVLTSLGRTALRGPGAGAP